MKSGVSILNPTAEDLRNYGMNHAVDSNEKPLWLGSPNITYAIIFAAPVLILCLTVFSAYHRITLGFVCESFSVRVGFECGQSATEARGKIFFDVFTAAALLFQISVVRALKYVSYLITDKYIHIFIEKNWCANIAGRTRLAVSKNCSRHFRYEWANLRRIEARSSFIKKNVGNIYLCNVRFDGEISRDNAFCSGKTYNDTSENGDIIKIRNKHLVFSSSWTLCLANILYSINNFDLVCDLLTGIYASDSVNGRKT